VDAFQLQTQGQDNLISRMIGSIIPIASATTTYSASTTWNPGSSGNIAILLVGGGGVVAEEQAAVEGQAVLFIMPVTQ